MSQPILLSMLKCNVLSPAERDYVDVWGPDTPAAVEFARSVERKMLARLQARIKPSRTVKLK
jgi:hypothetical protein